MTQSTSEAIHKAVLDLVDLNNIKKRTEEQEVLAQEATALIRENHFDILNEIFGESTAKIHAAYPDNFQYFKDILDNDLNKPPILPSVISEEYLNEIAIPHIYNAQTTIYGALETLEPVLDSWEKLQADSKELHRLVFLSEQQWKADAAFHMAISPEVANKIAELKAVVKMLQNRKTSIEKAQANISRLITLRTSTPTRQIRYPVNGETSGFLSTMTEK